MKILFVMHYNIEQEWHYWQTSQNLTMPTHILWGLTHLSNHELEVDLLPYEKYPILKKIGTKLKLGNLDHQLRAVLCQGNYDLVYCSGPTDTVFLSLLRHLGILRKPLVVKLERPFRDTTINRLLAKILVYGHDKVLCLSQRLYDQLRNDYQIPEEMLGTLEWGPHLSSYEKNIDLSTDNLTAEDLTAKSQENSFWISTGGENRDYNTLVSAFQGINFPLRVYCTGNSAPDAAKVPPHVSVFYSDRLEKKTVTFPQMLELYRRAYAIAIPLDIPPHRASYSNSYGLTSLLDALAMGKATLMTRNQQVDIDIEKEKIGFWLDYQDVVGWQQAISYLMAHPEEVQEMGDRAYYLAQNKYNLENYSAQLAQQLKQVGYQSQQSLISPI
ncbi:MAG: hypothetical protein VKJ24_07620 [Synechococcales bacterium]|nr:hypothetical protein [Synechococcales bacterium]